ncbi:MAG: hypothetical protein RLY16_1982 [Bacteroidota bacterium]|jgi:proline dehydrogenase
MSAANLPIKNTANISFDNTQIAFAYKSTEDLKKAKFLFASMGKPWLLNFGLKVTPWAISLNLPFTKTAIRKTIFHQFVGGETLEETAPVAHRLNDFKVKVILDYGVEGGHNGEEGFELSMVEFIRVINYAATQSNIPFMSIKVTGCTRFGLLERLDTLMHAQTGTLMRRYLNAVEQLTPAEKEEWHRVRLRLLHICEIAAKKNIGVLVDAEETWIQDPVDALTILMMDTFNKGKAIVYNTVQLYRHDRLKFLIDSHEAAEERDFVLGAKLVRGAYMEKERERAIAMNYPSPIQASKEDTDRDYDEAVKFCIEHIERIATIVATHNENSNLVAVEAALAKGIALNHPHLHFSQLFGMSDNITFNLANEGCAVSKYLPFGPIKDVIPYLMRRAQENSSVSGQTGRELGLIEKELNRRKS